MDCFYNHFFGFAVNLSHKIILSFHFNLDAIEFVDATQNNITRITGSVGGDI